MRYIFFLFLKRTCGYSLEAPHQGAPNDYPQHVFLREIRKNINFWTCKTLVEQVVFDHILAPGQAIKFDNSITLV